MDIAMFMIFILMDLIVVLVCRAAYGKKHEYREGMLFGVHIPRDALETEEISELTDKYRRRWILFQTLNLLAGTGVCFICFLSFALFMTIWLIWLIQYVAGMMYLVYHPHRVLYRIKMKNGWVRESGRRIVRIDTGVSARSQKMMFSWKWHLLSAAIILLCLPVLFLKDRDGDMAAVVILAVGLMEVFLFLGIHVLVGRRPNIVYSQDSGVNYLVNMLSKRAWGIGLIVSGFLSAASIIYMTIRTVCGDWLNEIDFFVYIVLQLFIAFALLFPILRIRGRRADILAADQSSLEVDDDEYWKNGWYSNPDDPHLFVMDRMNDMQFTMNMARPAAKAIVAVTAAAVVALLLFVAAVILNFENAEVTFVRENDTITIEAAGYDCKFAVDEVESAELIGRLPDDRYIRTNGGSTDRYDFGYYRGKQTGKCMMFLYSGYQPILKIQLNDLTVFVNSKSSGEVEEWYRQLKEVS